MVEEVPDGLDSHTEDEERTNKELGIDPDDVGGGALHALVCYSC